MQQRPGGYSPQNTLGPGPNMIPRGPQPSYKRSNVDNRGPPSVPSNKRFASYGTCSSYTDQLIRTKFTAISDTLEAAASVRKRKS